MPQITAALTLTASMKVNDSVYNSPIKIEFENVDLSFLTQFSNDQNNLFIKILSFSQNFKIISVNIGDKRLQRIWNLLFNTEMMQDYLLEDILHHYFIKTLPKFSLSNLLHFKTSKVGINLSLLKDPEFSNEGDLTFTTLEMDADIAPQYLSKFNFTIDEDLYQKIRLLLRKSHQSKQIKFDYGIENKIRKSHLQKLQLWLSSNILNKIIPVLFDQHFVDLSKFEKLKNLLTVKNLKIMMPSLSKFYTQNDDIVNIGLNVSMKSILLFLVNLIIKLYFFNFNMIKYFIYFLILDSIQKKFFFFRDQRFFIGNTIDLIIFDKKGKNSLCKISIESIIEVLTYLINRETSNLKTFVFDQPDLDILNVNFDKGNHKI